MTAKLARLSKKQVFLFCAAVALLIPVSFAYRIWWTANQAIADGNRTAVSAGEVAIVTREIQPVHSRFQSMLAAEFESAAVFEGDLFVASKAGLYRYSNGELKQSWFVGRDLPPHPLIALAVRTGIGTPELWITTERGGLLLYDGSTVRQMLPTDPRLQQVTAILPLRNGQVLLGTANAGLYITDGKAWRVFHAQFAKTEVTALAGDESELWIGTRTNGVWLWRGGEAVHLTNLPDKQVLSICARRGTAWIGTPLGVAEFSAESFSRRVADGVYAQALAEQNGTLWIGTADEGTVAIPLAKHLPLVNETPASHSPQNTNAFVVAGDTLLSITPQQILDAASRRQVITHPEADLANGHVTAIHKDGEGRLWVGYFDSGLDIVDLSGRASTRHLEDDVLFCVNRIKEDPRTGGIAVATANGLALLDSNGTVRQMLNRDAGLISSNITDILFTDGSKGASSMVIATPAGLSFVENSAITSMYAFQGLINNHVYTLAELHGTLYAGTLGGFSAVRNGLIQASFTTANSQLRQNWITASAAFDGLLYLGTYGSGIVQVREGVIESMDGFGEGRVEINPNAIVATGRALYAGTAGQGLAILRRGENRWRIVAAGLPSSNVTAIDANDGELYIGTDNGLVRAREDDLLP